jgi:uncharacterized protein
MSKVAEAKNSDRMAVLDVVRGFALAGILVINAMSILAVTGSTPAFTISLPFADRLLQDVILFFVESKFFTLFSLLFGIGFAIQIESAARQGNAFLPRISRRFVALFVLGALHILLLWDGDILVIYAITGFLLVLFRKASYVRIKRWVVGLLAIPGVLVLGIFVTTLVVRLSPSGAASLAESDHSIATEFANTSATQSLLSTSFLGAIPERIHSYFNLFPLLGSRIPTVLAMFLIGLYLGRSGFIKDLSDKVQVLRRFRFWGLTVGFLLMFLIVAATKLTGATSGLVAIIEDQYLAGPVLCLGYAAALTLIFLKNPHRRIFSWFSSVGRMALTNYLTGSLVLTGIAYGWGFGLAMRLSGFQVLAISAVLYATQVFWSTVWLRHFRYGPFEWVWRCATYWKLVPNRIVRQQQLAEQ